MQVSFCHADMACIVTESNTAALQLLSLNGTVTWSRLVILNFPAKGGMTVASEVSPQYTYEDAKKIFLFPVTDKLFVLESHVHHFAYNSRQKYFDSFQE